MWGGALDLHRGFSGLGGIYVIGARNPRDLPGREVFWKVGMSVNLRSRLGSHQICFPEGYYIRLLLTLPPQQRGWTRQALGPALKKLEQLIHDALKRNDDVVHSDAVHERGEWFKARFSTVYGVIEKVLREQGLLQHVRVHDDLADEKYGVGKSGDETVAHYRRPLF